MRFKKGDLLMLHDPATKTLSAKDWEVKVTEVLGVCDGGMPWYEVVLADKSLIQLPREVPESHLEQML